MSTKLQRGENGMKTCYAVAVKNGKAQFQRIEPCSKGVNVKVVSLSAWKLVGSLDLPKIMELVRMANTGQKVAFAQVYGMFNQVDKYAPMHKFMPKGGGL